MNWLESAIATGVTAFAATNIDDIVILMLFFAQVNGTFCRRHIVIGQYLGFMALIVASLPGYVGGLIVPRPWIGLLGFVPIAIAFCNLVNRDQDDGSVQVVSATDVKSNRFASLLNSQIYTVAAVTFANGGDNIGIYVPLFASSDLASLGVILGVFFVLVGVWCYLAQLLTRQAAIAYILTRYGQIIVPFVLIGLGIFILIENETYKLFFNL